MNKNINKDHNKIIASVMHDMLIWQKKDAEDAAFHICTQATTLKLTCSLK